MSGVLLDTNVLSELMRPEPDAAVRSFVEGLPEVWLSVITVHELDYGINRLPEGARRERLANKLTELSETYADRIVLIDLRVAAIAARFRADGDRCGRRVHLADALIAACAHSVSAAVATRDLGGFETTGIALIDPWQRRS
ncbi:MAG: PIN domain-containing protein [Pseudomonadota bacterium]